MKKYLAYLIAFVLPVFLISASCSTAAKKLQGRVVSVQDGDTFEMLTKSKSRLRVRLYGIDCPERGQPFSNVARKTLSELVFDKDVTAIQKDTDKYGRTVAIVYVGKLNVNEELLRRGLAWHYKQYDNNAEWARLEREAAAAKKGLWTDSSPTPPWQWRQRKRN